MDTTNFFGLEGKLVLVTGGGTGLGFAIAQAFLGQGAKILITGRREDVLKDACMRLGANAFYECLDVTDFDKIPTWVSNMEASYGPIDVLVNNAGIHVKKNFFDYTNQDFRKVITTNEEAVFVLTREVALRMSERREGTILLISSMASQYGIPKVIGYTAAKSAVEGMTRAMAVELSPLGIRVNCIAPGFIRTSMSASALDSDPERKAKVLGRTPMGDLGTPDDIGNAAVFLCSKAAKYITGVVLPVDGGNSIGF